MKELLGQLVAVKGVIISREKKLGTIKVEVSADAEATTEVTVETGHGKDLTTKPFAGTGDAPSVVAVSRPVYRIGVESIASGQSGQSGPACK
jgi:hypothetical protein